ncbi:endoplasmic reticulum junction formation protein lunapark-A isoform X5 [Cherax quadricarinatus]|uniref:endoplasmic reticulum junction formation protein lunapark-A isoform X5 n=1 Tax=Cherax quadricarinatus TaxID=27406 RepID=UPI00387E8A86
MGLIISRFRKQKSTKELLEQIQKDVAEIEEYRETTEQRQKRLVGSLVLYSIVLYLMAAVIFYFYYFPDTLQEKLLYATPFIFFIFLIYTLKRLLTWYYRRKISKNEEKLKILHERREKILEQVMETETYKVAKEILELYAPDQLRRTQMLKTPAPLPSVSQIAPTPVSQHSEVRRRVVGSAQTPLPMPQGSIGVRPLGPQVLPHQTTTFTPRPLMTSQPTPARPAPSIVRNDGAPPGPPMPRPVLPRERGYLDRFVEYLVGDGPANRFALVCRQCESHNGMALKDEFPYLAFRCAYCFYWNPARKQRPSAPRLENLAPLRPPSLPINEDQEDDDEQESSSSEEEDEDEEVEDEEGGVEDEESGSSSSAEDDDDEEGVVSSEVSSTKATSSQEGVCRPQQAGSLEDVAKSTPSSEPSTSDDHQHCETDPSPITNHAPSSTSSSTMPAFTTEAEETD